MDLKALRLIYRDAETKQARVIGLGIFVLWLLAVLFMVLQHAVWRDEVRALSIALEGESIIEMLTALHGEGHPAIWYFLLRSAYALFNRPEVLQGVALAVASAAVLLLIFRSPFSLPLIGILIIGRFSIFEFSVVARNYGISMLVLFLLAICYDRHRNSGIILGLLLFILANCNLHSVLLVGAFLVFWLFDIIHGKESTYKLHRSQLFHVFLVNTAIALCGVAICLMTIFPTFNDAAVNIKPEDLTFMLLFKLLIKGVLIPAKQFQGMLVAFSAGGGADILKLNPNTTNIEFLLFSFVIFGSTLGLVRRPGAFFAAIVALISLSMFFLFVTPGGYRHQALWLSFLICMYWITGPNELTRGSPIPVCLKPFAKPVSIIGSGLFILMLALQVPGGLGQLHRTASQGPPFSRSRDLGSLIMKNPGFHEAIILAEPDYLLESIPYYVPNDTFLMREQRFGKVVRFTRNALLELRLDDILANARNLQQKTQKPILILLKHSLDSESLSMTYKSGYNWKLITSPDQVRTFQSSAMHIVRLAPAFSDESFDVYILQ